MSLQHKAHPDRKGAASSGAALCRVYSGHAHDFVSVVDVRNATLVAVTVAVRVAQWKERSGGSCEDTA